MPWFCWTFVWVELPVDDDDVELLAAAASDCLWFWLFRCVVVGVWWIEVLFLVCLWSELCLSCGSVSAVSVELLGRTFGSLSGDIFGGSFLTWFVGSEWTNEFLNLWLLRRRILPMRPQPSSSPSLFFDFVDIVGFLNLKMCVFLKKVLGVWEVYQSNKSMISSSGDKTIYICCLDGEIKRWKICERIVKGKSLSVVAWIRSTLYRRRVLYKMLLL